MLATKKKALTIIIATAVLIIAGFIIFKTYQKTSVAPKSTAQSDSSAPTTTSSQKTETQESKPIDQASEDPNSILFVVNKKRPLPDGYIPNDLSGYLRKDANTNLTTLISKAKSAGINLRIISGYRSQSTQSSLYNNYVKRDGQASADTYSARPRYSEHQTGLAIDLGNSDGSCGLEICFGDSRGGQWLKNNAQEYGFIIRYPKDKDSITGYQYEPWHLRYVGLPTAKTIYSSGKTLEEYFNLPAAPSY